MELVPRDQESSPEGQPVYYLFNCSHCCDRSVHAVSFGGSIYEFTGNLYFMEFSGVSDALFLKSGGGEKIDEPKNTGGLYHGWKGRRN